MNDTKLESDSPVMVESYSQPNIRKSSVVNLSDIDARIQELAKSYEPFYKNGNLLLLYLLMIPSCLMASVTLGFDSAMMNGLQAVP